MKQIRTSKRVLIPTNVECAVNSKTVTVKGKFGTVRKSFKHLLMDAKIEKRGPHSYLVCEMWFSSIKRLAGIRSFISHVENMFRGAAEKFQYKMRLVYSHFPISVNISDSGDNIELRNFLGEKQVRRIKMKPGVTVTKSANVKDELILSGNDVDNVAMSSALIHQSTLVRNKDIRKFLDGIYVSEKGTVEPVK